MKNKTKRIFFSASYKKIFQNSSFSKKQKKIYKSFFVSVFTFWFRFEYHIFFRKKKSVTKDFVLKRETEHLYEKKITFHFIWFFFWFSEKKKRNSSSVKIKMIMSIFSLHFYSIFCLNRYAYNIFVFMHTPKKNNISISYLFLAWVERNMSEDGYQTREKKICKYFL